MTDFDKVKQAINLQQYITSATGLKMKRHHLEQCPICTGHDCFSIKDGLWRCYQCADNQGGDIFTFIEVFEGVDKKTALQTAAKHAGIELTQQEGKKRRLTSIERIYRAAVEYYERVRIDSKEAEAYLIKKRGHTENILKKMRVGWSDGKLVEYLRTQGFKDPEIEGSGLGTMGNNGAKLLMDFLPAGVAIFPHMYGDDVHHFTIKDPKKKYKQQLPAERRHKQWRFYNQKALELYDEVVLVEGENDLLALLSAGIPNVIAMIGQISQAQMDALKSKLPHKILYIWTDNDKPGDGYVRKISKYIVGSEYKLRVVTYPVGAGNDPDEYAQTLRELELPERRKNIKSCLSGAIFPLKWEILKSGDLEVYEEQLNHLRDHEVFKKIADLPEIERQVYIDEIVKLGFTPAGIHEELQRSNTLREEVGIYFETVGEAKNADPLKLTDIIYKNFSGTGRFFTDREHNVYLLYQHNIYTVANNRPFNALMKNLTGLLPTKAPGNHVWEALASDGFSNGVQIDLASWIKTAEKSNTIFINLNIANNRILKVSPKNIDEVENGINEDNILLKSSSKIRPFTYLPDQSVAEGLQTFRDIIWDGLACEDEQKYLIFCWMISAFLIEFVETVALLKFSGGAGSGKTTAAKIGSVLLFGDKEIGEVTAAAAYSEAARNPMVVIDNMENDDTTKSLTKFLLLSATGGAKTKRAGGSDSDTIDEKPKALICVTAIEPFLKTELINRTYDINFDKRFHVDEFIEEDALRDIIKHRDQILTSIIKMIAWEILPDFNTRKDYMTILKKEYRNHSKERSNAYLSMLRLILNKVVRYLPLVDEAEPGLSGDFGENEIFKGWIDYQNSLARDTETGTNDLVKMLTGLAMEYSRRRPSSDSESWRIDHDDKEGRQAVELIHDEYNLTFKMYKTKLIKGDDGNEVFETIMEFVATSHDIVQAFDKYARMQGFKNQYANARKFGARFTNSLSVLKDAGWDLISSDNPEVAPQFKIVRGQRYWKLRYTHYR